MAVSPPTLLHLHASSSAPHPQTSPVPVPVPPAMINSNFSAVNLASPDPDFVPRAEFLNHNPPPTHHFALLSFSGPNLLRLTRFPRPVLDALTRFFRQHDQLRALRQVSELDLAEFTLDARPWTTPKSVNTEQLILDVLSLVLFYGYRFLSDIDFGREPDDRLCLAFSRPSPPQQLHSPFLHSSDPSVNFRPISGPILVPFALSFSSTSVLRVIAPPLRHTPAILQAVRSAWPRGMASEKSLRDNSYEFKLKGYKWFQEDTYATDSLHLILSLLNTLDSHGFSLLTSFSLGSRSRAKDFWIFTGSQPPELMIASGSSPDLLLPDRISRVIFDADHPFHPSHKRSLSPLGTGVVSPPCSDSVSSPIAGATTTVTTTTSNILRKPAPRAQMPVSVLSTGTLPPGDETDDLNTKDMTGVGAGRRRLQLVAPVQEPPNIVIYATDGHGQSADPLRGRPLDMRRRRSSMPSPVSPTDEDPVRRRLEPRSRSASGGGLLDTAQITCDSTMAAIAAGIAIATAEEQHHQLSTVRMDLLNDQALRTPPLLGSNVFRDSAFSSNTKQSYEIPVGWRGSERAPLVVWNRDSRDTDADSRGRIRMVSPPNPLNVNGAGRDETKLVVINADPADTSSAQSSVPPPSSTGEEETRSDRPKLEQRVSTGPLPPGGWISRPSEEGNASSAIEESHSDEETVQAHPRPRHESSTPANLSPEDHSDDNRAPGPREKNREVDARVTVPDVTMMLEADIRHSEAGLIGMMACEEEERRPSSRSAKKGSGEGWVLVNVEGGGSANGRAVSPTSDSAAAKASPASSALDRASTPSHSSEAASRRNAKGGVWIDSVAVAHQSPSGFKQLFTLSKGKKSGSRASGEAENEFSDDKDRKKIFSRKRGASTAAEPLSVTSLKRREKRVSVD